MSEIRDDLTGSECEVEKVTRDVGEFIITIVPPQAKCSLPKPRQYRSTVLVSTYSNYSSIQYTVHTYMYNQIVTLINNHCTLHTTHDTYCNIYAVHV